MIFDLVVRWLIPFLCGSAVSVCSVLWGYIHSQRDRDKAIENGLQCLLRAEIIRSAEKYIEKGYCPIYGKESITKIYDIYHALGGNDVATELYRQIMKLPNDPPEGGVQNEKSTET